MQTIGTILIVEDDQDLRMTLSDILQAKGFTALEAAGGKPALQILLEENPAVTLIDLKLPDIDGFELLRRIREQSPTTECIVVTGHAPQVSVLEAIRLGAFACVQKPYDVERLLVIIRRAMERRQAEAALRESEEGYRRLVRTSPDAVIACDLEGGIQYISGRAVELFCAGGEGELLGRHLLDLVISDDRGRLKTDLQTVIRDGVVWNLDLRLLRRGRESFFGELSSALVSDDQGIPKGILATAQEIPARKQRDME